MYFLEITRDGTIFYSPTFSAWRECLVWLDGFKKGVDDKDIDTIYLGKIDTRVRIILPLYINERTGLESRYKLEELHCRTEIKELL